MLFPIALVMNDSSGDCETAFCIADFSAHLHQSTAYSSLYGGGSRCGAQLVQQALDVCLNRTFRDEKPGCYFLIALAGGHRL